MSETPQEHQQQDDEEKVRFQVELEFVQCLANPAYLNYLAQFRFFSDPSFVAYLKYLTYWKKPEFAKFLTFPHCLHFLDLLQDPLFRDAMLHDNIRDTIWCQQHFHWRFYRQWRLSNAHTPPPTQQ